MKRNRYLDEIGLKPEDYGTNYLKNETKLFRRFRERKIYGFDYRETINLDRTFIEWLYSHLRMYVDYCKSDLSFHTIEFDHKKYTIKKAINEIMDCCKEYLIQKELEVTDLEINGKSNSFICRNIWLFMVVANSMKEIWI
jgi:hypothetical protein